MEDADDRDESWKNDDDDDDNDDDCDDESLEYLDAWYKKSSSPSRGSNVFGVSDAGVGVDQTDVEWIGIIVAT